MSSRGTDDSDGIAPARPIASQTSSIINSLVIFALPTYKAGRIKRKYMFKDLDIVEEFYGTEEQESPEYKEQVETEFLQAFYFGTIKQT